MKNLMWLRDIMHLVKTQQLQETTGQSSLLDRQEAETMTDQGHEYCPPSIHCCDDS